ncbi:hypothetical protein [Allokutzneria sp. NRRL B-24872]|uniref:hypothetical protein n=1 Tax=Allokutzneria sp. NRRL B-24872 TaxID=1137961 RepID=UPI001177E07B|nr:hypothetical protein [Allokutzneria sp. NRRL B-24872]
MYPQQPYPQQPMPPQPGFGRVLLDTSFSPLNWFLFFIKPTVVINGQPRQVEWGQMPVDLPAGQHTIEVGFQYMGKPRGLARVTIPVHPGQVQPVFYRAPAYIFIGGAMGPTRPATPGAIVNYVVIGVAVLMMLMFVLLL